MKELDANDVQAVVNFDNVEACKKIDTLCPVLSTALKGAMGENIVSRMESHLRIMLFARYATVLF